MQATRIQTSEKPQARPDSHIEENRRLRGLWAHDPSARLLLDADSATRRIARAIASLFGH